MFLAFMHRELGCSCLRVKPVTRLRSTCSHVDEATKVTQPTAKEIMASGPFVPGETGNVRTRRSSKEMCRALPPIIAFTMVLTANFVTAQTYLPLFTYPATTSNTSAIT